MSALPRSPIRRLSLALLLLPCLVAARPALARSPEDLREVQMWMENGMDHYRSERFREAVMEFRKALFVLDEPGLIWNIARAYEELEEVRNAVHHFERLVDRYPDDESVPAALERLASLRPRLPGSLVVGCGSEATARVRVDGEQETGCEQRVTALRPGWHTVAVTSEARGVWHKRVRVAADAKTRVLVVWEEAVLPPPEPEPERPPADPVAKPRARVEPALPVVAPAPPPPPPPPPEPPSSGPGWGALALLGAGGAVAVGGVVFGLFSERAAADFEALKGQESVSVAQIDEQAQVVSRRANVANVLFGVGGATLVAGVVLALAGQPPDEPANEGLGVTGPAAGSGLVLSWRGVL